MRKQHGETRCVITVTKHEYLVQREPDQLTGDKEHEKRSPIHSLLMSTEKQIDGKEYQDISQIALDVVKKQGNPEAHETLRH